MSTVRLGVVGLGNMGSDHGRRFVRNETPTDEWCATPARSSAT